MTVTALSIALSSLAFHLALQMILQRILQRRTHSKDFRRRILMSSIYIVPSRASRDMEISGEIRISAPNRDMEGIPASLRSFVLSPSLQVCRQNGRQVCRQNGRQVCRHVQGFSLYSIRTPVELSFQP
ncbi:hypothetical protein AVEN_24819-1 [Araneus ventricosus]|uniref:Uncharacterized protein n=1 Tax=Araneus ventricosus TaxID=182803 RepID=A0A4Y2BTP9_ARAVE|nr:hypothetical protein AVEN_24819-1 [Araneus ventricosus]